MYKEAKYCVKVNGELSEFFQSNIRVRQGENLSPVLFSIFINVLNECAKFLLISLLIRSKWWK